MSNLCGPSNSFEMTGLLPGRKGISTDLRQRRLAVSSRKLLLHCFGEIDTHHFVSRVCRENRLGARAEDWIAS